MSTLYPTTIDTVLTLPTVIDNSTSISAEVINRLRDAILALESELGVKPSGLYTTVRDRLDVLEMLISSGTIGGGVQIAGDLGGTENNPKVVGLQTFPVSSTAPTIHQLLTWSGSNWTPTSGVVLPVHNTTITYTATNSDHLISVGVISSPITIFMPSSPVVGQEIIIKDQGGGSASNNITANGNGHNIDGASTYLIDQNYAALTLIFSGTEWSVV